MALNRIRLLTKTEAVVNPITRQNTLTRQARTRLTSLVRDWANRQAAAVRLNNTKVMKDIGRKENSAMSKGTMREESMRMERVRERAISQRVLLAGSFIFWTIEWTL